MSWVEIPRLRRAAEMSAPSFDSALLTGSGKDVFACEVI
jgi:hypothetical protein